MSNLTLEERETHFLINATDRSKCHVGTNDDVWVKRLNKWFTPTQVTGEWHEYEVDTDLILREYSLLNGTVKLKKIAKLKNFQRKAV
jgi:hypothetical protein